MEKNPLSLTLNEKDLGDRFQVKIKVNGLDMLICVSPYLYDVTVWRNRKRYPKAMKIKNYAYGRRAKT